VMKSQREGHKMDSVEYVLTLITLNEVGDV